MNGMKVVFRVMYVCAYIQLTADKMQNEFLYFRCNRHIDPNKIGSEREREKKQFKKYGLLKANNNTLVDKTNSHVH